MGRTRVGERERERERDASLGASDKTLICKPHRCTMSYQMQPFFSRSLSLSLALSRSLSLSLPRSPSPSSLFPSAYASSCRVDGQESTTHERSRMSRLPSCSVSFLVSPCSLSKTISQCHSFIVCIRKKGGMSGHICTWSVSHANVEINQVPSAKFLDAPLTGGEREKNPTSCAEKEGKKNLVGDLLRLLSVRE
jgi:hypothetical protein